MFRANLSRVASMDLQMQENMTDSHYIVVQAPCFTAAIVCCTGMALPCVNHQADENAQSVEGSENSQLSPAPAVPSCTCSSNPMT